MNLESRACLKEFCENQMPWWGKVPCTFKMKASFCFWEECSWLPRERTQWPSYKSPWGQGASACLLLREWTPSRGGPDERATHSGLQDRPATTLFSPRRSGLWSKLRLRGFQVQVLVQEPLLQDSGPWLVVFFQAAQWNLRVAEQPSSTLK